MFFKNAQVYRLAKDWGMTAEGLEEQLAKKAFHPCGSQDMESRGWVSPNKTESLVAAVGGQWLVALGFESRILPGAVVKQEAEERAQLIAEQQGFKPGKKQMKEIKEAVLQELLPRAFTKRSTMYAWIDPVGGWLVVDASSLSRAEDVVETLRHTLESFPLTLLRTERSPVSAMADWLAAGEAPEGFTLDSDFSLKSVSEDKAEASFKRHGLESAHVKDHLEAGKLPTRLAMTFDDRVSFVLTDKGEVKRIDLLDVAKESLEGKDEDAEALFQAEFALMAGELSRLFESLVDALGGELTQVTDEPQGVPLLEIEVKTVPAMEVA